MTWRSEQRRRVFFWLLFGVGLSSLCTAVLVSNQTLSLTEKTLGALVGMLVALGLVYYRLYRALSAEHAELTARTHSMLERLAEQTPSTSATPKQLASAIDDLTTVLEKELASLEHERNWLEGILENGTEGILVTDPSGRIILANRALRAMVRGGDGLEGKLPIEAIRNNELAALLERVLNDDKPGVAEVDLGTLDAKHFRVHAAPLNPSKGVVAMLYDVTDLRRLETMRRDFVANVSHELRTPIAAIRASVETLEGGALEDPEISREFVGIISRHAERLHALVEDLLDLSRLDARRHEIDVRDLDVNEALESLRSLFQLAAERKEVSVVVAPCPRGLSVRADKKALERVLANYLDNAIKYSRAGDKVVMKALLTTEGQVRVEVTDSGPGIEASHHARLFERFYRANKGRSRDLGGTGLGLAIAKHLAEAMNGAVGVKSEVGVGSTFFVELPSTASAGEPRVGSSKVVEAA